MKTSKNGIELIKKFEGCRLTAYRCAAGVWTIGYGHTEGVKAGQSITQAQAESFLKDGLMKYEKNVEKYDGKYHWNQNEFDALVSFAFNIGSIDQLTANGTRNREAIAGKMPQYNKAAGKAFDGLTKRRAAERELFLKPVRQDLQASSMEPGHIQLNYRQGGKYKVMVEGLRVRTKKATQDTICLLDADIIGGMEKGAQVTNHATARVGDE